MCHLPLSEFDSLCNELDEYNPQRYIVAYEGTPYEHYHFLVQADNVEQFYTRFRKKIFIDKYKLCGQAKKDKRRQYGKVKDIEDLEKMASYTVKNENFRVYNIEQEELDNIIDSAFNKNDREKLLKDRMCKYVENEISKGKLEVHAEKQSIMICIIQFCLDEKIDIRRTLLENYYFYFRQKTVIDNLRYRAFEIYNAMFKIEN